MDKRDHQDYYHLWKINTMLRRLWKIRITSWKTNTNPSMMRDWLRLANLSTVVGTCWPNLCVSTLRRIKIKSETRIKIIKSTRNGGWSNHKSEISELRHYITLKPRIEARPRAQTTLLSYDQHHSLGQTVIGQTMMRF